MSLQTLAVSFFCSLLLPVNFLFSSSHPRSVEHSDLFSIQRVERLLGKVRQQPPQSTRNALLPAMKALITDELLRHADVNIQVAVASCISELTRITSPNPPYTDDEMKEAFQLFMIAFQHLSCETGPNYARAVQILETVAKVRSSLILLDIDCDFLIIEMFQLFFTVIRSNHPSNVLKYMEMIMTLVIEECDEVSVELLRPLLSSVKMDYKSISPVSWELGETVFRTCATKLYQPLREAVKTMNLNIDDYARIVSPPCKDACDEINIGAKVVLAVDRTDPVAQAGVVFKLDRLSTGSHEDNIPLAMGDSENEHLISNSARSDVQGVDAAELAKTKMHVGTVRRRVRKPKSTSKHIRENLSNDSINEGSLRTRGRPKKNENIIRHLNELKSTSGVQVSPSVGKGMLSNDENKTENESAKTLNTKKEEYPGNDVRGVRTLVLRKVLHIKQNNEYISHNNESKDVADKVVKSCSSSRPSKMSRCSADNWADNLVDKRVKVWWPKDMMFYEGTVRAYYPLIKKHLIEYDDGDQEILSMRNEKWEVLSDQTTSNACLVQKQEGGQLSPGKYALDRTPKRKELLSVKLKFSFSSKRAKDESNASPTLGEISAPGHSEVEHRIETGVPNFR